MLPLHCKKRGMKESRRRAPSSTNKGTPNKEATQGRSWSAVSRLSTSKEGYPGIFKVEAHTGQGPDTRLPGSIIKTRL
jgi:hypothetical protein